MRGDHQYAFLRTWNRNFPLRPQFLGHLLAFPQADKIDRKFLAWCQSRQQAHALRQLINVEGLAHFQNKGLPAPALPRGSQNQVNGFGNGHEISSRPRVGHVNWFALLDLIPKEAEHTSRASRHIAESYVHESGRAVARG